MRASELMDRTVRDTSGNELGRVAELIARPDEHGRPRIVAVLVTPRDRGRLFGYDRRSVEGPWVLRQLTRWMHHGTREVPWADVVWPDAKATRRS